MANNNPHSGYPFQYLNQQQWPPQFIQQQDNISPPEQGQQYLQQSSFMQYQQPGQSYQIPSRQVYSSVNPPPSPQQLQQHYQYRTVPSPSVNYSPGPPQYDGITSQFGHSRQGYPSPQTLSPQQHNQYVHAHNQQALSMPQRQLSYPHPQQFQRPSPQLSQRSIPPSPQMSASPGIHMQQFQAPPQSPVFQAVRNNSVLAQSMSRQSQSPVTGSRKIETGPILHSPQAIQSQRLSQSPITSVHSGLSHLAAPPQSFVTHNLQSTIGHAKSTGQNVPVAISQQHQFMPGQSSPPLSKKPRNQEPLPLPKPKVASVQNLNTQMQSLNAEKPAYSPAAASTQPSLQPSYPTPPISTNKASYQGQAKSTTPNPSVIIKNEQNTRNRHERPPKQIAQPVDKQPVKQIEQIRKNEPVRGLKSLAQPVHPQRTDVVVKNEFTEEPSRVVTEIDYALLLIDLSEEYFDAAYGKQSQGQPAKKEADPNVFYKLIATGLGCLEVVLKQWRSTLQPAVEAAIRLRYASILHKETNNVSEAEEVLSKGITQCDKLRLWDSKYNMQHLLARVTFTTNPKAASKLLDSAIRDVEAQNHIPWIYAFRFLRASLSLELRQAQETSQALAQLKVILNQAKTRGDIAVAATASAIEAMIHIRKATSSEAIEQAQAALTTVRSAENNPSVPRIPQLVVMAFFVDLICSLFKSDSEIANTKMKAMHQSMDELANHEGWNTEETFLIPIGQQSAKSMPGTASHGAVVSQRAERTYLKLAWLSKNELYALGSMLGAATVMHKASSDKKCEELFDNAEAFLKLSERQNPNNASSKSHEDLVCHLQVLRVFASCCKNAWGDAKKLLNNLKVKMANMTDAAQTTLPAFIIYLEGMISQGTGDTKTALVLYDNPMLSLSNIDTGTNRAPVLDDLAILATLNTILVIHQPSHPQHARMPELLALLENLRSSNPSNNLRGAHFLIRALDSDASKDASTNPILNTKDNLRHVLELAKHTGNSQFSCITLTFMTDRFFTGQVGEQAYKSASTALNLARRGKNDLWTSVAESLLADCLETRGDTTDAAWRKEEALHLARKLPLAMQVADEA